MNLIVALNYVSAFFFLAAIVVLACNVRKLRLSVSEYVPLLLALTMYGFVSVSNILEHSEITDFFDPMEDIAESLFLLFILFFLISWKNQRNLESIREQEQWRRITMQSVGDGILCADQRGHVTEVNTAMERLVGMARQEILGQPVEMFLRLVDRTSGQAITENLFAAALEPTSDSGTTANLNTMMIVSKTGEQTAISAKISPIIGEEGSAIGAVGIFHDTTEYDAINEQLSQVHKMEAVGQMAGGVAHDLNNMLGGIIGAADLLAKSQSAQGTDGGGQMVQLILKASGRAAELTSSLLTFSRRDKVLSTPVSVREIIETTIAIAERTIARSVTLESSFYCADAIVIGDPAQLQTAILNLILNSRDALTESGTIKVELNVQRLESSWLHSNALDLTPGEFCCIAVSDNGTGIDAKTQKRIFEPFFSTKEAGKGTGLGLAAVLRTMKNHHGAVMLESELGKGSTFRLFLPLAHDDQLATNPASSSLPNRTQSETKGAVLIIEDEAVVRVTTEMMVKSLGYRVHSASSPEDGIELFRLFAQDICAVILDMVMPRYSGEQIFRQLRAIDPNCRVIFTSGIAQSSHLPEDAAFLQKPYREIQLDHALAAVLQDNRSPLG